MSERKDRPLSALKDVQRRQESIIKDFVPGQNQDMSMARQQSIRDRERAALSILNDKARCEQRPLECLNTYCTKTKAVVVPEFTEFLDGSHKIFRCNISFSSRSKNIVEYGEGTTKKEAQNESAKKILNQLRELGTAKPDPSA
jgi:hypothetical protein